MKREHVQLSYLTFKKNKKAWRACLLFNYGELVYSSSKALAHSYPS